MSRRSEWAALVALVLLSTAFRAWAAVEVPVPSFARTQHDANAFVAKGELVDFVARNGDIPVARRVLAMG